MSRPLDNLESNKPWSILFSQVKTAMAKPSFLQLFHSPFPIFQQIVSSLKAIEKLGSVCLVNLTPIFSSSDASKLRLYFLFIF